jgi:hypothetical protein
MGSQAVVKAPPQSNLGGAFACANNLIRHAFQTGPLISLQLSAIER